MLLRGQQVKDQGHEEINGSFTGRTGINDRRWHGLTADLQFTAYSSSLSSSS